MGYLHIENLYKDQTIMLFKKVWVLEKIHGTSANISWTNETINFFSGGEKYEKFVSLFNRHELIEKFKELGHDKVHVYGEAYGGKQQNMKDTYGDNLKFIVFDVKIGDTWLDVPDAADVASKLGLEFVSYTETLTDLETLNYHRDKDSAQAFRNGMGWGKKHEGVILRPFHEMTDKRGNRIIVKHKRDEFKETKTSREVNPEYAVMLEKAEDIANEWVTDMRFAHVIDKLNVSGLEHIPIVISAMIEDVYREGKGEIVESKEVAKAIGQHTVKLYKQFLNNKTLTHA